MSINVIEINDSNCKYVKMFTHHVGSIGAPSRRAVFIRGTNTKQWEVPKATKANIFQKGGAGFKTTIDENKSASRSCFRLCKECRLNFSKQQYKFHIYETWGKNNKNRWTQSYAECTQAYWHLWTWWEFQTIDSTHLMSLSFNSWTDVILQGCSVSSAIYMCCHTRCLYAMPI
jgi:hypothetical protein